MKKILAILGILILTGAVYLVIFNDQTVTYRSTELGLEFDYLRGPDGYVLEETVPQVEEANLVKRLTLFRTEDTLREMPVGGEGPPVIVIQVFTNPQKQWATTWANTHIQYSSINLKIGDVMETAVGGAQAIRYKADGLYASNNAVIAHGENIYVVTGQYIDENSDIRRDFESLLESIRFIAKPSQE